MKKTYVIGDVHGCYHTMIKLIKQLPKNSDIIFVGDLCDRGLYTKEVIDFVIENEYKCLLGNHDEYMIEHAINAYNGETNRWLEDYMGGQQTLYSYKDDLSTLKKHIEYLKTLPNYIMIDNYFITHGFGLPYYGKEECEESKWLNKNRIDEPRDTWQENWQKFDEINIFGHIHYSEVNIGKNYYGIDTGCVYGGKLTAIEFGSMKIYDEKYDPRDVKYRIGITGNRDISPNQAIEIKKEIEIYLKNIIKTKSSNEITIITPLADGVDRLIVNVVLENNLFKDFKFLIPLPMPEDIYLETFGKGLKVNSITPEQSKIEYKELIKKIKNHNGNKKIFTTELEYKFDKDNTYSSSDLKIQREKRRKAYQELGVYLIKNSHFLISVYNEHRELKKGSTLEIVNSFDNEKLSDQVLYEIKL